MTTSTRHLRETTLECDQCHRKEVTLDEPTNNWRSVTMFYDEWDNDTVTFDSEACAAKYGAEYFITKYKVEPGE